MRVLPREGKGEVEIDGCKYTQDRLHDAPALQISTPGGPAPASQNADSVSKIAPFSSSGIPSGIRDNIVGMALNCAWPEIVVRTAME